MADITDPTAISFSNSQLRPLADAFARFHTLAKATTFYFQAKGMGALFPDDATATVRDSANADVPGGPDGRTPITGADAVALIGLAEAFVAGNEANANQAILTVGKIAVNP